MKLLWVYVFVGFILSSWVDNFGVLGRTHVSKKGLNGPLMVKLTLIEGAAATGACISSHLFIPYYFLQIWSVNDIAAFTSQEIAFLIQSFLFQIFSITGKGFRNFKGAFWQFLLSSIDFTARGMRVRSRFLLKEEKKWKMTEIMKADVKQLFLLLLFFLHFSLVSKRNIPLSYGNGITFFLFLSLPKAPLKKGHYLVEFH